MGNETKLRAKKVFWFPIALLAVPVDWVMWNLMYRSWLKHYKGYKPITLKEAWDTSWKVWRAL